MASEQDNLEQGDSSHPPGAVTIKVFATATAADASAALLEANNITCWLHADDCGGMLSVLDNAHGVKLLVSPADADAAKVLLAATPVADTLREAENSDRSSQISEPPPPRVKLSFLQIAAGMVIGVLLCLLYQWTSRLGTNSYPQDSDGDGRADENWVFRDVSLVEQTFDRNFDGQLDAWNSFDPVNRRRDSKSDDNFDGEIDVTWNYTNGVLESSSFDTDFNGKPDVTYYYKHDLCTRADWRPNGTNIITLREFYRHGKLTEALRDTNFDGSFDVSVSFDAFQNPISTNAPLQIQVTPP